MSEKTKISWADATWNPLSMLCTPCSPGCDHCWHLRMAKRQAANSALPVEVRIACAGETGPVLTSRVSQPLQWKTPKTIAVQLMGDLFHESVEPWMQYEVYRRMALAPQHTYMMCTKRAEIMAARVPDIMFHLRRNESAFNPGILAKGYLENIAHGVTVCNQAETAKLAILCRMAGKLWVSYEPALSAVDFTPWPYRRVECHCPEPKILYHDPQELVSECRSKETTNRLSLVVAGGETGPGARPAHPQWFRKVRDDCKAAGTPLHLKSLGEWSTQKPRVYAGEWGTLDENGEYWSRTTPWNGRTGVDSETGEVLVYRIGKALAGRVLDGQEHDGGIAW